MLTLGIKNSLDSEVIKERCASWFRSGLLDVYATPMMIALMEVTCNDSVLPYLEEGESTVGTKVDINHIAATPIGIKVHCESELIGIDRRRLTFKVVVFDNKEKIGEGIHERFIVNNEKFMAKAMAKTAL